MQKRAALGRGLAALLPTAAGAERSADASRAHDYPRVAIDALRPAEYQPRKNFDDAAIGALAASIQAAGVLQPLLVRRTAHDPRVFEIIAGERRWRAAQRAGLREVPVVVKDVADDEAVTLALEENLQREDLNPIEEAESLRRLLEDHQRTHEDLAKRLGRDRTSITNTLRLLRLPRPVQALLASGELSVGHAKALLMVDGAAAQESRAKIIVARGLSVRAAEALCRGAGAGARAKRSKRDAANADGAGRGASLSGRAVEEQLQRRLGTKVRILPKGTGGQIVIDYYSLAELERLVDQLAGR
jgi:ParB family chromosome partitioning protein